MDDEVNVTRREFERLVVTVDNLNRDQIALRIELAVQKTKVALFSTLFGTCAGFIPELIKLLHK